MPSRRCERLPLIDTGAESADCISDTFYHELNIGGCEPAERNLIWGNTKPVEVMGRTKLYFAWPGAGGKKDPSIDKRVFYVVPNLGVLMSLSAQANQSLKLMEY